MENSGNNSFINTGNKTAKIKKLSSLLILPVFIFAFFGFMISCSNDAGESDAPYDYGTVLTVCDEGCEFKTIQEAIDFAEDGYIIRIQDGTYAEDIVVDKRVAIIGAGVGKTTITGGTSKSAAASLAGMVTKATDPDAGTAVVQLAASGNSGAPLLMQGFGVKTKDRPGISVAAGAQLSFVELDGVEVSGTSGTDSESGFFVGDNSSLSNLTVKNAKFNNLGYGVLARKLAQATFENCTADKNKNAGIDVTLESGDAKFKNCTVTDNGDTSGAGLSVKASSGTKVEVDGGHYVGNNQGIVVSNATAGNNPDTVTIKNANIQSSGAGNGVVNNSSTPVDANDNYWGENEDPQDHISSTGGAEVTVTEWYDTEDKTEEEKVDYLVKEGSSIQDVIDKKAESGDVIKVADGTFSEKINFNGKSLTLKGSGTEVTIVDAGSVIPSSGYAIENFGNGSKIKDLTLIGTKEGNSSYGFKISHVSDITLENIKVTNSNKTGIDLNTVNTATLKNIEVTGTTSGFGVMILDSKYITITDVKTSNNAWGGVSIQSEAAVADNIKFLGSFEYEAGSYPNMPLLIEQDPPDPSNPVYKAITNLQIPAKFGYAACGFRETYNTSTHNFRQWYYAETKEDADNIAFGLNNTSGFVYSSVNVYDVVTGKKNHYVAQSVQDTINTAESGDVINIAAGTYDEVVDINKRLILQGTGSGDEGTILTKNTSVANPAPYPLQVDGATYTYNPVVIINASGLDGDPLTLKDLKIEPRQDIIGAARQVPAILFRPGASTNNYVASYSDIELDNIRVIGTMSDGTPESGVRIDGNTSLFYFTVNNSEFSNMGYGMIFHNKYNGTAQSNVQYVEINDTVFNNNSIKGFYTEKLSNATFNYVTATNNGNISLSPSWADLYNAGIDINLKYNNYVNLTFNNLTVTGNGIDSDYGAGLTVKARGTGDDQDSDNDPKRSHPATLMGVTINNGTFTGNETAGIRFGEPDKNNTSPTNIKINKASVTGNTADVDNQLSGITLTVTN